MNNPQPKQSFSLRRLEALSKYYSPIVKWQMIIYAAISLVCAVLLLMPVGAFLQFSLFTMIYMVLPFLFMLSPLILARNGDARMVECQLPVSATEKLTYYTVYFLIVIPLLVFALPEFALWLYTKIPSLQNELMTGLIHIRWHLSLGLTAINFLTATAGVLTCLCVVLKARNNRIIKAVGAVIAVQFSVGILGGIYGMYTAFKEDFADRMTDMQHGMQHAMEMRMQETVSNIDSAWLFQLVSAIMVTFYLLWMFRTIYKTLRRGDCCL